VLAKLGPHAKAVESAYRGLPEITHAGEYDWQAREREERRQRECFALSEDDANAARPFGCLLELTGADSRGEHRYVTDPESLADRLAQKIAAHVAGEEERKQREHEARERDPAGDDPEPDARGEHRQRDYETCVSARGCNLDLGAALAKWQPRLDTDAVKLLGSLVPLRYGKAAAWAHRLCVEQPATANKQAKVTVRYPRAAQAEKELLHRQAQSWPSSARSSQPANRSVTKASN